MQPLKHEFDYTVALIYNVKDISQSPSLYFNFLSSSLDLPPTLKTSLKLQSIGPKLKVGTHFLPQSCFGHRKTSYCQTFQSYFVVMADGLTFCKLQGPKVDLLREIHLTFGSCYSHAWV